MASGAKVLSLINFITLNKQWTLMGLKVPHFIIGLLSLLLISFISLILAGILLLMALVMMGKVMAEEKNGYRNYLRCLINRMRFSSSYEDRRNSLLYLIRDVKEGNK